MGENSLIFCLLLKKFMDNKLENLFADIGAYKVKNLKKAT